MPTNQSQQITVDHILLTFSGANRCKKTKMVYFSLFPALFLHFYPDVSQFMKAFGYLAVPYVSFRINFFTVDLIFGFS